MLIHSEYDIHFQLPAPTPFVALLHLHPSLESRLCRPEHFTAEAISSAPNLATAATALPVQHYQDSFGNHCSRFLAPAGNLRLTGSNTVDIDAVADPQNIGLTQLPVEQLPSETLQFLLASRYCQVDQFVPIAQDLFGHLAPGWDRAAAIRDWVHDKIHFDYKTARPTKTALDVFTERIGVCRDFQHLAITLTRCMNLPTRYVTGYLGDIRIPAGGPGDFSAWYQVWLDGRWWDMDARHNTPRLGRILMATGRDAADVALTTSFGVANLTSFRVESNEITPDGQRVPLPASLPAALS